MTLKTAESKFPSDVWQIIENGFNPDDLRENESVFALGNGYIGMRGNLEEGGASGAESICGSYLNGVFDSAPITYGEGAYGYAKNSETICNVADAKGILLEADGESLDMGICEIENHRRTLDMQKSVLIRELIWKTKSGALLEVETRRLVSLTRKHQAAEYCRVKALSGGCELSISSGIRSATQAESDPDDPRTAAGKDVALTTIGKAAHDLGLWMVQSTANTCKMIACAVEHCVSGISAGHTITETEEGIACEFQVRLAEGQEALIEKSIAYHSGEAGMDELLRKSQHTANSGAEAGFAELEREQVRYMTGFWENAAINIDGDDATLQGLRFNMFHLLQSAGRDGKTNIAAKGLTGEGYEGHCFWDTEAYILPFFIHTQPEVARKLLEYRYSILDNARERARTMGHHAGALYPWRTIDGEECSAYYPAGTAQYHINADIAYAVRSYVQATGDMEFLAEYGAEMLVETARLWYDLGFFNPNRDGKFCINCVTGPDEYNVLVNNNVYTNLMARENMRAAIEALEWMEQNRNIRYGELCAKLGLSAQEADEWLEAADKMYLPYDTETEVIPQDDGFLSLKPWPIKTIPKDTFPLLLHYHPLVIYRHQVCKQADLILAMVFLGNQFSFDQKKTNFFFYDGITTHDSSLSMAMFSILASEIGERETAYRYFEATARLDLDNMHHNTKDGLHMANMAGTWLCLVQGFGGMRQRDGKLSFSPYLPEHWNSYGFHVQFKGRTISVFMNADGVRYELLHGDPLTIYDQDGTPILLQVQR